MNHPDRPRRHTAVWSEKQKVAQGSKLPLLFFSSFFLKLIVLNSVCFSLKKNQPSIHPKIFFIFSIKSLILRLLPKEDRLRTLPWGTPVPTSDQFKNLPGLSGQPSGADLLAAAPVSWFCPVAVKPDELRGFSFCGGSISSALCNLSPQNNLERHLPFLGLSSCCLAAFPPSLCPSCRMFQHVSERECRLLASVFGVFPSHSLLLPRPSNPSASYSIQEKTCQWLWLPATCTCEVGGRVVMSGFVV